MYSYNQLGGTQFFIVGDPSGNIGDNIPAIPCDKRLEIAYPLKLAPKGTTFTITQTGV